MSTGRCLTLVETNRILEKKSLEKTSASLKSAE